MKYIDEDIAANGSDMNFQGKLINWFDNRKGRMMVEGHSCDWKPVTSGVLQWVYYRE